MIQSVVVTDSTCTWLIGDTHFDHYNIMKYCGRPFVSVASMNETLIANWNAVVKPLDTVLFLGDLTYGPCRRAGSYFLERLSGRKLFVRGNHDWSANMRGIEMADAMDLVCEGERFLLTHDPWLVHERERWVIHGHTHDNQPLWDLDNGMISVSVEVTGYRPVSFASVMDKIAQWRRMHLLFDSEAYVCSGRAYDNG